MPRLSKYLLVLALLVFVLACNLVAQPINDAQNVVETVQSLATAMPLETLQSIATSMPVGTLQALPSAFPEIGNMIDPQGEPVAEWNGIPIMPQATAGQEVDKTAYSFKVPGTVQDAKDFYDDAMVKAGWSSENSMPATEQVALMFFSKDDNSVTIIITAQGDSLVVYLTFA